jgi:hypothetical protein
MNRRELPAAVLDLVHNVNKVEPRPVGRSRVVARPPAPLVRPRRGTSRNCGPPGGSADRSGPCTSGRG